MSISNLSLENDNMSDDYLRSLPETLQSAIEYAEDRIAYIPSIQQKIEVPETEENEKGELVATGQFIEIDNPEWHSELDTEKTQLQDKVNFFNTLIAQINVNNYTRARELISENADLVSPTPFKQNCFNPNFQITSRTYNYSNYNLSSHSSENGYVEKTSSVNDELEIIRDFLSKPDDQDWFQQYRWSSSAALNAAMDNFQKAIAWIFMLSADYSNDFYLKRWVGGYHRFRLNNIEYQYRTWRQWRTSSTNFSTDLQQKFCAYFQSLGLSQGSSTWENFLTGMKYDSHKNAAWILFKDHLLERLTGINSSTSTVSKYFLKYTQAPNQHSALGFYQGTYSSAPTAAIYSGIDVFPHRSSWRTKYARYNDEIENYKNRYIDILRKLSQEEVPEETISIDANGTHTKAKREFFSLYYDISDADKHKWFKSTWNKYQNYTVDDRYGLLGLMRLNYEFIRRTFFEKDFITGNAVSTGKHQAQYGREQFLNTRNAYNSYIAASSDTRDEKHLIYLEERIKFDFYINYYLWALDYVLYQFSVLSKAESELCQLEVDIANSCVEIRDK